VGAVTVADVTGHGEAELLPALVARCDPVRRGRPASAGDATGALALAFPRTERAHLCRLRGRPGIYFLSLDAARLAAVAAARRAYRLPYFHAEMSARHQDRTVHYESKRVDPSGLCAQLRAHYAPMGPRLPVDDGALERWLAERYCLYVVDQRGRALRADIHHPPWVLQPAAAVIELNTMAQPLGLGLDSSPLLHYSARQDTLIWALEAA
jgi:uncharacterized protein